MSWWRVEIHRKHVEQFADVNKLYIFASCWTTIDTYYVMHGPVNIKKSQLLPLLEIALTNPILWRRTITHFTHTVLFTSIYFLFAVCFFDTPPNTFILNSSHLPTIRLIIPVSWILPTPSSYLICWTKLILTYSMQHNPSWEANRFSGSQKIPRILWDH